MFMPQRHVPGRFIEISFQLPILDVKISTISIEYCKNYIV